MVWGRRGDNLSTPRHEIDRRSALKLIGGAAAGIAVSPRMLASPAPSSKYALVSTRPYLPYGQSLPEALRTALTPSVKPSLAFQAIRTTDMVYLGFEFYNAKAVVTAGQTEIVAENTEAADVHGRRVPFPAPRRAVRGVHARA